jgi:multisubunit Na+/H+ antiporter MnhB subunit
LKVITYIVVGGFTALLVYASLWLPAYGGADAPINRERTVADSPVAASYYIRNAYADAHTPNIVTVVLADYRGFDTFGETLVVLTAGIACSLILRRKVSS